MLSCLASSVAYLPHATCAAQPLQFLHREIAGCGAFAGAARHVETNRHDDEHAFKIQPPTSGENALDSDHTRLYKP